MWNFITGVVFLKTMKNKETHALLQYTKVILESQEKPNLVNNPTALSGKQLIKVLSTKFPWQTLLWNFLCHLLHCLDTYLILDDTVLEKRHSNPDKQKDSFIRYAYSNKENKVISGIHVVFLLVRVGFFRIPLGFRIYDGRHSKLDLALEMLSVVRNQYGLRKQVILFDSWYSAKKVLKRVHGYGWTFVCRIKRNRKVSGISAKAIFPSPYGMCEGEVAGIKIQLVRHGKYYLICNRLGFTKQMIRDWYGKRQEIEEFFRVMKTKFHLKGCQSCSIAVWMNHIFACCIGFLAVEFKRVELGITIYKARKHHSLEGFAAHENLWEKLLTK